MIAGWLISCLKVEVSAFGASTFECQLADGWLLNLKMDLKQSAKSLGLREVIFNFEPNSDLPQRVRLVLEGGLAIYRDLGEHPVSIRQIEDVSLSSTLSRFFLVGESVRSYTQAAQSALVLENLMRGYSVGGMS